MSLTSEDLLVNLVKDSLFISFNPAIRARIARLAYSYGFALIRGDTEIANAIEERAKEIKASSFCPN